MRGRLNTHRTLALFFASGAVALSLEAAWFRRAIPVFGASHAVSALVLSVYMSGLALGSALGAWLAPRVRSPLRAYALCELCVALSSLASLPLFAMFERSASTHALSVVLLMTALALLTPTIAMGATTPLVVRAQLDAGLGFRPALSALYAANLAGAATGALVTGFLLLPRVGLRALIASASVVALTIALVAWRSPPPSASSDEHRSSREHTESSFDRSRRETDRAHPRLAAALALGIGALSFALQVSLGRAAALLLGSTAYTFELLVAVILGSLALGGRLARRATSDAEAWPSIVRRCTRLAVAVFLSTLVVRLAPTYVQLAVRARLSTSAVRWALTVALAAWSYLEIGAIFVILADRMARARAETAAGRAAALTTVGNVCGAILAGFVAIPSAGLQRTLVALAASALAAATIVRCIVDHERWRSAVITASLAVLIASSLDRPWDAGALSAGTFRTHLNRSIAERAEMPCGPGRALAHRAVLFARDGALGTVSVLAHSDHRTCTLYGLRVNGKTEGSVFVAAPPSPRGAASVPSEHWLARGDLPSQRFVGAALASAFDERIDRSLVIGWGTGISVRALHDRSQGAIVVAEIEPAVLEASRWFDPEIARDPRVTILLEDARRALRARAPASLDAIASHPSNPWVTGATALFSREFFALARSRLRPGGRMLAWVQLYEIDLEGVRSLVATFADAFTDVIALRAQPGARDLFLLGAHGGVPLDPSQIEARLRAQPETASARVIADGAALRRFASSAPRVTDDNALLEFRVADVMLSGREDPRLPALDGLCDGPCP